MKYLIVGAGSVAGQAAVQAVRKQDADAYILATTSKDKDLEFADATIHGIDLNRSDAARKMIKAAGNVDILIYCPAFGPVGFPVEEADDNDYAKAVDFSLAPMKAVADGTGAQKVIGFSAFYWLPHITIAYGGMAAAKVGLDYFGLNDPRFHIVRLGTFFSNSIRGICILINREIKKTTNPRLMEIGQGWKQSGMKFPAYFFKFAHGWENEIFSPKFATAHRETLPSDMEEVIRQVLARETSGTIVNRIGDWQWEDSELPNYPAELSGAQKFVESTIAAPLLK